MRLIPIQLTTEASSVVEDTTTDPFGSQVVALTTEIFPITERVIKSDVPLTWVGIVGLLILAALMAFCRNCFIRRKRKRRGQYNTDMQSISMNQDSIELVNIHIPPPPPLPPVNTGSSSLMVCVDREPNLPDQTVVPLQPTKPPRNKLSEEQKLMQRLLGEQLGDIYARRNN